MSSTSQIHGSLSHENSNVFSENLKESLHNAANDHGGPEDPKNQKPKKNSSSFTIVFAILAFAMVATSFSRNPFQFMHPVVFHLGTYTVRENEFQLLLSKEQAISVLSNRPIKTEKELLTKLIEHLTLDLEAETLGLDLSDNSAKLALQKYPLLQENGVFSKARLQKILMHHGLGIQDLIDAQKRFMIRDRLLGVLGDVLTLPENLKELWLKGRFQIRRGLYKKLTFPPMVMPLATKKELQKLYEDHKADMTIPAFKSYSLLKISGSSKTQEECFSSIDTALSEGKTIEEISKEFNFPRTLIKINTKDSTQYEGGEDVFPLLLESNPDVLDTLENLTPGSGDLIVLSENEGFFVFLEDITPERPLKYEEPAAQKKLQELYEEKINKDLVDKHFKAMAMILEKTQGVEKANLKKTMTFLDWTSNIHGKPKDHMGEIVQHLFQGPLKKTLLFWRDNVPYMLFVEGIKTQAIPESGEQQRIILGTFQEMILQCFLESLGQKFRTYETWHELLSYLSKKKAQQNDSRPEE